MTIQVGQQATPIQLPAIDGTTFDTARLASRRHMLSFFRFATCPFCNMRINELVQRANELHEDFAIVAIFNSPLKTLAKHASEHAAPFPILADEAGDTYATYGIERSVGGMLKGMVTRMPTLMKGMAKGHVPTTLGSQLLIMPASFLVDERGVIQTAYYGADEGDHLNFDDIEAFARAGAPQKPR